MRKIFTVRKVTVLVVVVILLVVGLIYIFVPTRTGAFKRAYADYTLVATQMDAAAFYPASDSNPTRRELYNALSESLVGEMNSEEREALAEDGLELLKAIESDIDLMGEYTPRVEAAIEEIEATNTILVSQKTRSTIDAIVEKARRRLEIIADVRGLSYRANFHAEQIFTRILSDNGELTAEHTALLNEQIPQVEEQFDERSGLYSELESVRIEINNLADSL